MKKDIKENVLSVIESLKQQTYHNTISVSVIVAFKMHSKSLKFVNNFLCSIPHKIVSNKKVIVFNSQIFDEFVSQKKNTNLINGLITDHKKIKKHIYMCVGKDNIDKIKSILNRKSILPNNSNDFDNIDDRALLNDVLNGTYIKVYQMNNTINFKCGSLSTHSTNEITENIMAVMKFISEKGFNIKYLYITQCMNISNKIHIRK